MFICELKLFLNMKLKNVAFTVWITKINYLCFLLIKTNFSFYYLSNVNINCE